MVDTGPCIIVAPPGWMPNLVDAVREGGGTPVGPDDPRAAGAEAVVWATWNDPAGLAALLDARPTLRWTQLPWAGIDPYVELVGARPDLVWTCAKGVYADPVAEHALALALASLRSLDRYARARSWSERRGRNLFGARVTILGGGGIARSLLRLLEPFRADVTVVRSNPEPLPGAARVLGADDTDAALTGAELVVLALPLTPATVGLVDRRRLGLLAPGACLVNVARGEQVVTDDVVAALRDGTLGGAGLDVTDPEPLPDDHPLWALEGAIVTPHTGNTPEMAAPLLGARVRDNVRRWIAGDPLLGPVDPALGY